MTASTVRLHGPLEAVEVAVAGGGPGAEEEIAQCMKTAVTPARMWPWPSHLLQYQELTEEDIKEVEVEVEVEVLPGRSESGALERGLTTGDPVHRPLAHHQDPPQGCRHLLAHLGLVQL